MERRKIMEDPYVILGISRNATKKEIKKAYRQCAKRYHPDLNSDDPNANEKMNKVNQAYDMLTQPERFTAYKTEAQQRYQEESRKSQQQQGECHNHDRKKFIRLKRISLLAAILCLIVEHSIVEFSIGKFSQGEFVTALFFGAISAISFLTYGIVSIVDWYKNEKDK